MSQPVREIEEGGDGADVPDGTAAEPVGLQALEIVLVDPLGRLRQVDGEIQHRAVGRVDVGSPVVRGHLLGQLWVLGVDAQQCAVGHDAVETVVDAADSHDDQLYLLASQFGGIEQGVVVGDERPELLGPVGHRPEDVGRKARSLRFGLDSLPHVGRQRVHLGGLESTHRLVRVTHTHTGTAEGFNLRLRGPATGPGRGGSPKV